MLFLAIRQLLSRKRQTFFTLLGIILGTTAYIAISGMMLGFQSFIVEQLVNNDAHIRISAREEWITESTLNHDFFDDDTLVNWLTPPSGRRDNAYILYPRGWMDRLDSEPTVAAYSPQLVVQAIASRAKVSQGIRIIGSDPVKQSQVTNITQYMLSGKFTDLGSSGNRIIVGDVFLKKMGAAPFESIQLSSGKGKSQPFKIVGVFHLGIKSLDESTVFASLQDTQNLNQTPSRVSDIAVRLLDVSQAADIANHWNGLSQDKVQSWDQANEGTMSVFKTQDIVRNSMTVSILIVAGFGIYNILSMAVNNKKKEIAILRSIGFVARDILNLFLIQGVILGLLGGIAGSILGFAACKLISQIPVSANRGLGGNTMMMVYFPIIYIKGFLLAFLSSSFASLLPARAAGRLSPIAIIRGEDQ